MIESHLRADRCAAVAVGSEAAMRLTYVPAAAAGAQAQTVCGPTGALACDADLSDLAAGQVMLEGTAASVGGPIAGRDRAMVEVSP